MRVRAVRKYLCDVAEFWLGEVGIAGWRLDVAGEVQVSRLAPALRSVE